MNIEQLTFEHMLALAQFKATDKVAAYVQLTNEDYEQHSLSCMLKMSVSATRRLIGPDKHQGLNELIDKWSTSRKAETVTRKRLSDLLLKDQKANPHWFNDDGVLIEIYDSCSVLYFFDDEMQLCSIDPPHVLRLNETLSKQIQDKSYSMVDESLRLSEALNSDSLLEIEICEKKSA